MFPIVFSEFGVKFSNPLDVEFFSNFATLLSTRNVAGWFFWCAARRNYVLLSVLLVKRDLQSGLVSMKLRLLCIGMRTGASRQMYKVDTVYIFGSPHSAHRKLSGYCGHHQVS